MPVSKNTRGFFCKLTVLYGQLAKYRHCITPHFPIDVKTSGVEELKNVKILIKLIKLCSYNVVHKFSSRIQGYKTQMCVYICKLLVFAGRFILRYVAEDVMT